MSTVNYYMNAYSSSVWTNPSYAVNGSTGTLANTPGTSGAEWQYCSGNTCGGTSLGLITKVEYALYYQVVTSPSNHFHLGAQPEFNGSSLGTLRNDYDASGSSWGPGWGSYHDITSDPNHPTWGVTWTNISNLDINFYCQRVSGGSVSQGLVGYVDIRVTYTPHVASTLTWVTPASDNTYVYRNKDLSINGTAANTVAGVKAVQYKIDSGSWVACSGTTAWSATIAAATLNALTVGSHTISTRVQRNGDDAWTNTTARTFIISPLPAQII